MKKILILLLAFPIIMSCAKDENEPSSNNNNSDELLRVRALGKKVSNPTNAQWCIPSTADTTLSSVRCISNRFYYMDFLTDLHFQQLEEGEYRTYTAYEQAFSDMTFKTRRYRTHH